MSDNFDYNYDSSYNGFSDLGPTKPEEFPHLFGKPVQVFGRNRVIRPFSRIKQTLFNRKLPESLLISANNFDGSYDYNTGTQTQTAYDSLGSSQSSSSPLIKNGGTNIKVPSELYESFDSSNGRKAKGFSFPRSALSARQSYPSSILTDQHMHTRRIETANAPLRRSQVRLRTDSIYHKRRDSLTPAFINNNMTNTTGQTEKPGMTYEDLLMAIDEGLRIDNVQQYTSSKISLHPKKFQSQQQQEQQERRSPIIHSKMVDVQQMSIIPKPQSIMYSPNNAINNGNDVTTNTNNNNYNNNNSDDYENIFELNRFPVVKQQLLFEGQHEDGAVAKAIEGSSNSSLINNKSAGIISGTSIENTTTPGYNHANHHQQQQQYGLRGNGQYKPSHKAKQIPSPIKVRLLPAAKSVTLHAAEIMPIRHKQSTKNNYKHNNNNISEGFDDAHSDNNNNSNNNNNSDNSNNSNNNNNNNNNTFYPNNNNITTEDAYINDANDNFNPFRHTSEEMPWKKEYREESLSATGSFHSRTINKLKKEESFASSYHSSSNSLAALGTLDTPHNTTDMTNTTATINDNKVLNGRPATGQMTTTATRDSTIATPSPSQLHSAISSMTELQTTRAREHLNSANNINNRSMNHHYNNIPQRDVRTANDYTSSSNSSNSSSSSGHNRNSRSHKYINYALSRNRSTILRQHFNKEDNYYLDKNTDVDYSNGYYKHPPPSSSSSSSSSSQYMLNNTTNNTSTLEDASFSFERRASTESFHSRNSQYSSGSAYEAMARAGLNRSASGYALAVLRDRNNSSNNNSNTAINNSNSNTTTIDNNNNSNTTTINNNALKHRYDSIETTSIINNNDNSNNNNSNSILLPNTLNNPRMVKQLSPRYHNRHHALTIGSAFDDSDDETDTTASGATRKSKNKNTH